MGCSIMPLALMLKGECGSTDGRIASGDHGEPGRVRGPSSLATKTGSDGRPRGFNPKLQRTFNSVRVKGSVKTPARQIEH